MRVRHSEGTVRDRHSERQAQRETGIARDRHSEGTARVSYPCINLHFTLVRLGVLAVVWVDLLHGSRSHTRLSGPLMLLYGPLMLVYGNWMLQ